MGLIIIIFSILAIIFVPRIIEHIDDTRERKEFVKWYDYIEEIYEGRKRFEEEREKQFLEQIRKNTLKNNKNN